MSMKYRWAAAAARREKEEIQAIRYVATGAEIPVSTSWVHSDYPTMAFADLGEDPVLPDGVDTVIDVILKSRG